MCQNEHRNSIFTKITKLTLDVNYCCPWKSEAHRLEEFEVLDKLKMRVKLVDSQLDGQQMTMKEHDIDKDLAHTGTRISNGINGNFLEFDRLWS